MSKAQPERRRNRWWIRIGIIIGVIVILILLLPTIASYIVVPGMIRSAIATRVDGKVEVSGTSFSWFGSQKIETIKLVSRDNSTALDASIEIDRSLLGLMFGWPDVGKVVVTTSGKGTLLPDGSTSFTKLAGSSQPKEKDTSSDGGSAVPAGLDVDLTLHVTSLELDVVDMKSSVVVSGLEAKALVQAGGPVDLTLTAKVESDGRTGTLDAKFKLDNGVAADGRLQLADAALSGTVTGRSLRLPASGQWVEIDSLDLSANSEALGKSLQVSGDASGTLQNSTPISLQAKLELGSLVGEDGGFTIGPDSIAGSVNARSIPTSLLQPFLGDSPIQLVRDVGPQLNLSLDASAGSAHAMHLEMDSQYLEAKADLTIDTERISNGNVTIDATLSKDVLAQLGVQGEGDVGVAVQGTGLGVKIGSDGQVDLASFAGEFNITTSGSLGSESTGELKLSGLRAKITTQGLQQGVDLDAEGNLGGATLKANAKVTNLLVDGKLEAEGADLQGSVSLANFDPVMLEPLMGDGIPPGLLADASGGPMGVDVQLARKESGITLDVRVSAPDLNGSADVKITESAILVNALDLTARIEPKMVDQLMPDPNSIGHLASEVDVKVSSKGFTYDLGGDSDVPLENRLEGQVQATVDHLAFTLVDPPETVVLQEMAVDTTFSKKHALQFEANAKVATTEHPLGSARVDAKMANLDQPSMPTLNVGLEIADVGTVATIAGIDPGPLEVLLGPTATLQLDIPAPASAESPTKIVGTIKSPRANGQFQASLDGGTLESTKVNFTTKLVPGDLEKALGANSGIRLGNNVTVSATVDASGFTLTGEPLEGAKANATLSANAMHLSGEDGTTIVVDGTNGTATVNGRALNADFSATIANRSGSSGNGRVKILTHAKLAQGEEAFQIGDTILELDSVPTFIFELVGAEGRMAEAALGKSVDSKATVKAAGAGRSSVKAQLTSPYASLEMPQAWLQNSLFDVPGDQKIRAQLKVSQELSREILSVLHPIFADISTTEKPIILTVGPLTLPFSGDQTSKLNGQADLEIGDVMLTSTNFGSHMLMFLGNQDGSSVPAHFSPLKVTATNGLIEYKDFIVEIGRGEGRGYKQKLIFNGKINLASDPPEVIGISASFPASNLAGVFKELQKVPAGLLGTIRPKVTFYGPLYDANGNRIPLKSKIDPLNLDDGLKPDQIHGIIQGIGDLIRKKN